MTAAHPLMEIMHSVKDDLVWLQTGNSLTVGEQKTVRAAIKRIEDAAVANTLSGAENSDACEARLHELAYDALSVMFSEGETIVSAATVVIDALRPFLNRQSAGESGLPFVPWSKETEILSDPPPGSQASDWITWSCGRPPVASDVLVEVRFTRGETMKVAAGCRRWDLDVNHYWHINAYRLINREPS